jgi:predicted NAD/FAD-binding protein
VYLHSDASVLSPSLDKDLHSQYYDPNPNPTPNNLEGSFSLNVGRGFELPKSAGPVYVTGYNVGSTMKRPAAQKVFAESSWRHTISTPQMVGARSQVHTLQGTNRTWYCGESMTFSAAEAALTSGYVIGQKLGASYPFNPSTHPWARQSYLQIWNIMFPGTTPP